MWFEDLPLASFNTNYNVAKGKPIRIKLFTPSMEAFIIADYDNNKERWEARAEYYLSKGDWNANLPERKKTTNEEGKIVYLPDRIHDAKYSSATMGNIPFGSWNKEGLIFFSEKLKAIKAARANPQTLAKMEAFEVTFRKYLQDKYKEGGEYAKKKGRKKRKVGEQQTVVAAQPVIAVNLEELDADMFG